MSEDYIISEYTSVEIDLEKVDIDLSKLCNIFKIGEEVVITINYSQGTLTFESLVCEDSNELISVLKTNNVIKV